MTAALQTEECLPLLSRVYIVLPVHMASRLMRSALGCQGAQILVIMSSFFHFSCLVPHHWRLSVWPVVEMGKASESTDQLQPVYYFITINKISLQIN